MKKLFIMTAAATALVLAAAAPAQAGSYPRKYTAFGHTGTATDNGAYQWDSIALRGPAGQSTINVYCTGNGGYEWKSHGTFTKDLNDRMADKWCSSF